MMIDAALKNYAESLVREGEGVQEKRVVVSCDTRYRALCYLVMDYAVDAGATDIGLNMYDENDSIPEDIQTDEADYAAWMVSVMRGWGAGDLVHLLAKPPNADLMVGFDYPAPSQYKKVELSDLLLTDID